MFGEVSAGSLPKEAYVIIGAIAAAFISAIVAILVSVLNNWHQRKIAQNGYAHQLSLEKLKIEHARGESDRAFLRARLEEVHETLSRMAMEHSLTASYIHSNRAQVHEYHERYLTNCRDMDRVRAVVALYFPDLHDEVEMTNNEMNLFWGSQQNYMDNLSSGNTKGASIAQQKVVDAAQAISTWAASVKRKLSSIATELNR